MNKDNQILCLDVIALLGICAYCFFSSLFGSDFAEICLNPSFLNFPIFLSEQLLFILGVLFIIKMFLTKKLPSMFLIWVIYAGWILILSLTGYMQWGPFTFRNAALFYYVFFALFAFSFYNPRIFKNQIVMGMILFLSICLTVFKLIGIYFWYTYVILIVVVVLKIFNVYRWWLIPIIFLFSHCEALFVGKRAHMIGIFGSILFLGMSLEMCLFKFSRTTKLIIFVLLLISFAWGASRFGDSNAVKSIFGWKVLTERYAENKRYIDQRRESYKSQKIPSQIYHKNPIEDYKGNVLNRCISYKPLGNFNNPFVVSSAENVKADPKDLIKSNVKESENVKAGNQNQVKMQEFPIQDKQLSVIKQPEIAKNNPLKDAITQIQNCKTLIMNGPASASSAGISSIASSKSSLPPQDRDLEVAYSNILFRIFIWQDMWEEIYPSKLLTGVGLGKPQRSSSLEILNWAEGEWSRDGWIMPHNSFFHMIYRAGIIGLFIIISLLGTLIYLTRVFIQRKDISGILLISISVYWCLMAMFSVTLELPYYAVLFWSLLGMTYAYAKKIK